VRNKKYQIEQNKKIIKQLNAKFSPKPSKIILPIPLIADILYLLPITTIPSYSEFISAKVFVNLFNLQGLSDKS